MKKSRFDRSSHDCANNQSGRGLPPCQAQSPRPLRLHFCLLVAGRVHTVTTAAADDAVRVSVDRLASVPEGDGTLLDNVVVVWCGEANHIPLANAHGRLNLPYLLAGGAGGALKTGRYLNFQGNSTGQYGQRIGVPNNRLFLSLCHLMGLTDVSVFGKASLCSDGPLPGLS
jgi:hypothetical protein